MFPNRATDKQRPRHDRPITRLQHRDSATQAAVCWPLVRWPRRWNTASPQWHKPTDAAMPKRPAPSARTTDGAPFGGSRPLWDPRPFTPPCTQTPRCSRGAPRTQPDPYT